MKQSYYSCTKQICRFEITGNEPETFTLKALSIDTAECEVANKSVLRLQRNKFLVFIPTYNSVRWGTQRNIEVETSRLGFFERYQKKLYLLTVLLITSILQLFTQ